MGRFDLQTETIHADWWGEDETVTITEMTYAKSLKVGQAGMGKISLAEAQLQADLKPGEKNPLDDRYVDGVANRMAKLEACVVSWTFKKNGKIAPLTMLKELPSRDGDFIMEAINKLNPDVSGDDFREGTDNPLPDGQGASAK
jgi:hypothetical protein